MVEDRLSGEYTIVAFAQIQVLGLMGLENQRTVHLRYQNDSQQHYESEECCEVAYSSEQLQASSQNNEFSSCDRILIRQIM